MEPQVSSRNCTFCSNSDAGLGAEIYDSGYVNVTNIDISTVAINQMSANCADREEMECKIVVM